jgi:hypothetical protein
LRWIAFAVASIAGTLANPYGAGLWRFLASTVRAARPDITEWAPLDLGSPLILWAPVTVTALAAVALNRRAETRLRPEVWAVLLLLIAGAIRVERVAGLVAPAALVLLAPYIRQAWGSYGRFAVEGKAAATVFWIPAVVALAAAAAPAARPFTCLRFAGDWAPDVQAAAHLRGANGRLLTTFDWGEYAIWHFGPRLRVSIDGRRETVYSDHVIEWHRAFERGDADGRKVVAELAPDYVWLRSSKAPARQWLADNGYRVEADTGTSFVAARSDLPRLAVPRQSLGACFP